tara:strand:- start:298 stop:420 length:123 start_codon:yes stop_codon:yes gene_type:complete
MYNWKLDEIEALNENDYFKVYVTNDNITAKTCASKVLIIF